MEPNCHIYLFLLLSSQLGHRFVTFLPQVYSSDLILESLQIVDWISAHSGGLTLLMQIRGFWGKKNFWNFQNEQSKTSFMSSMLISSVFKNVVVVSVITVVVVVVDVDITRIKKLLFKILLQKFLISHFPLSFFFFSDPIIFLLFINQPAMMTQS